MVVELVALRRLGAEQRPPGGDQVGALEEVLLVDQEVLLLGPDRREDALCLLVLVEDVKCPDRRLRERVHRAQERDLRVQRLAGPRRERGRDAEQGAVRVLEDERGAGRVPGGVAAGLEGGADAAGGERRGVGLALDQLLAREAGDRAARAVGLEERIMLFRGHARKWLEDVRVVGRAALERPLLHRRRDLVGERGVERLAGVEGGLELLERVLGEDLLLDLLREDVLAERVVVGLGEIDGAEGAAVGLPLCRGHVLLADLGHVTLLPPDDAGARRTASPGLLRGDFGRQA